MVHFLFYYEQFYAHVTDKEVELQQDWRDLTQLERGRDTDQNLSSFSSYCIMLAPWAIELTKTFFNKRLQPNAF